MSSMCAITITGNLSRNVKKNDTKASGKNTLKG